MHMFSTVRRIKSFWVEELCVQIRVFQRQFWQLCFLKEYPMTLQDMYEPAALRCWKFMDVNTQRLTLLIFPVKRTKRNLMSTSRTNPSWLFNRKLGGNVLCLLLFHIICFCVCWKFSRLRLPINICWKN